jgi:hypothetical protein
MKRPPDRKLVLAALVLLVAASTLMSKPEASSAQRETVSAQGDFVMLKPNRLP